MPVHFRLSLLAFLFVVAMSADAQTGSVVCGDPRTPCQSKQKEFAPYELSFRLPAHLRKNTDYRSVPFYAIILKNYKDFEPGGDGCDGGEFSTSIEAERKAAQNVFPEQKVFASYQCPDMAAVEYRSGRKTLAETFIAVYGGTSSPQAQRVLEKARARYPEATMKQLQAVYNWQVE